MPGSLLIGSSTYSDGSDISGRSLGGKKVSFNKAVRVKQYPWRANGDTELSVQPSDRFWFKVYRNSKPFSSETLKENGNYDEYLNDSLVPISEVDDQISDNTSLLSSNNRYHKNIENSRNEGHIRYVDQPVNQYIGSLDERNKILNRDTCRTKPVRNINELEYDRGIVFSNDTGQRYQTEFHHDKLKSIDENSTYSCPVSNNRLLPRIDLKYDGLNRRSLRRSNYSQNGITRERRSRSHDDYIDNDCKSEGIRKVDKSVSTEDLNFGNNRIGSVKKSLSKDAATQYYDTLTRNRTDSKIINTHTPTSFKANFYDSLTERLKKFESPRSGLLNESNKTMKANEKNYALEKLSSVIPSRSEYKRKNDFPTQALRNQKQYASKPFSVSDISNSKPTVRTVNGKTNGQQKEVNLDTFKSYPRKEENPYNRNNWNQRSSYKEKNGNEHLAKCNKPLREVNTNTHHGFLSTSTDSMNHNAYNNSKKNHTNSLYTRNYEPTKIETSSNLLPKRYLSPSNQESRSFKNGTHSSESCRSPRMEPIIDWSHSGFQLAPKSKYSSASDSEYTVNKRPPLLMYIPGVSHHDRPAEEDDRLSHLSDLSRSDLYDGSQLSGFSTRNRNIDDLRLRRSMREGKSKWLNWRKKS